ncbi:Endo-1,4-beta-xylanase A [Pseudobythopirellula maris]|uniref:Endo-1,4-beta-xylanase A n=1 Tax=Pseudobythopirellula maris TaxID=2527991 RepID=A0A5C5ZTN2_9BACT|nr:endo-1,4-beta-xylanase [Pseudobythopirellula maris]TWT90201.1 Endo-1,4-beta-xylanase A [Pseudobythopirellula maris]
MRSWTMRLGLAAVLLGGAISQTHGQTLDGDELAHRSGGYDAGAVRWTLDKNGYVGTYFTLDEAGPVTIKVDALGTTNDATLPMMGIAVADQLATFEVGTSLAEYGQSYELPAGTYFVRTELSNHSGPGSRTLSVDGLTIEGASSISNTSNRTVNEANALAMADSYIENFRQGSATAALPGAAPGSNVTVRMRRNEFNFGTYVTGFSADPWVGDLSPGETATDRARYQEFVPQYFNMLVPSNMGKWQPTENSEGSPQMGNVDAILDFAADHNMAFRQHNLAWGHQQPWWVNNLIDDALAGDPQAKADLRQAVIDRIAYYVGDGDNDQHDGDRARQYEELDVINELLREKTYYDIFGDQGVAEIYKLTKDAVDAAGADTLLMTNEYNLFNFAGNPLTGGSDHYANWYREHIETLNNQGFGQVVTGVGIQAQTNPAPDGSPTSGQNHNPSRMNQVLQNMSILGMPITLTEFSVPSEAFGVETTPERAAEVYTETLRMMFGTAQARSMLIWEEWPPNSTNQTTIVDENWDLTVVGEAFVALMEQWTTDEQLLTVGPDGMIEIAGFYGEYEVVIDGETFVIDHLKGVETHSLVTADFLPGDFNTDGVVDAADFTVWRDSLGQTGLIAYSGADSNGDGEVTLADYDYWVSNFGMSLSTPQTSAPEPGSVVLFAWSLFISAPRGQRRKWRPACVSARL